METLNIKNNYYEKIKELYDKYKDDVYILERGLIIVKELFYKPDLLILGLNPSYNPSHDEIVKKQHNLSFWYPYLIPNEGKGSKNDIQNDHIFLEDKEFYINTYIYEKYYNYLKKINFLDKWEYFDLFWVRESKSEILENLPSKTNFLEEQIQISIEIIKKIHPKIIVGAYGSLNHLAKYTKNDEKFLIIETESKLKEKLEHNSFDNLIIILKFLTYLPKPTNYSLTKYIVTTDFLLNYLKL